MVKNTVGGKKGKMMANKNGGRGGGGGGGGGGLRMIEFPEMELMVCVTKVFGGGLFEVVDNNGVKYMAFLRGKMRGHNKRHNLVSLFSILLVGKRIDTDPTKCDILFVYDASDIQFLALNPQLNISNLLFLHNNHFIDNTGNSNTTDDDLFLFNTNNTNSNNNNNHTNSKMEEVISDLDLDLDFNCI